jgi:cytochrome c
MIRAAVLATAMLLALAGCGQSNETAAPADPAAATVPIAINGLAIFNRCAACHAVKAGAPNGVGPNLYGIVGAKIAAVPGYTYSTALKAKAGVWDREALDGYIAAPRDYVPGTKMAFGGLSKPEERAAVIDYLATLK